MPPAQVAKPARPSIYGQQPRKRSVSPTAHQPEPKGKAPGNVGSSSHGSMSNAQPRRIEEGPYFEEDYQEEIMAYMHEMDTATIADANLMDMQPELQWFMRPYLIDFLIEVHQQFRLRPEVLYLAMNIVDRYVSKRVVYKKHYQLVGCAALWIAAKFEDGKDKVPLVKELADMCCKAYDESAFIQMEHHVLSTVGWIIGHPTAEAWLRTFTTGENHEEAKVQHLARFLMEITLFHREFVGIRSSDVANGALMLARFMCGKARKPSNRSENVAVRVAFAIDKHFGEKLEHVSEIVIRKYAPTYYGRCSTICREWYLSGRRFSYNPETPATPVSALSTPGLAPSGWPGKRGSWVAASPSTGSISCSSSDAGDEPLTPITPVHVHDGGYPFTSTVPTVVHAGSVSAKENIAPPVFGTSASVADLALAAKQVNPAVVAVHHGQHALPHYVHPRSVLHPLPTVGELTLPARAMRRLSN
ncbi:hypothetical protein EHS25_003573 [Saitozyma podzolica]|uniref:Uncharacterized protein n=1 Tax=Saitozyma podzolica TaxID=1890683 RepID=A0A427Y7Q2_9TREE|nr:hypothetical protein EHS25_003573 [Saitozyma podzolica]